tara:strand:- start:9517 stop:10476 length:960 start_codon:yes stop_codon:yes gene_type:complete
MTRYVTLLLSLALAACKPIPDSPTGPGTPSGPTDSAGRLAFVGSTTEATLQVLVVFPDGTDLVSPIGGSFNNVAPAWSADGTRIAFASNRGSWDIYTVDLATGQVNAIVEGPDNELAPSWSPDRSRIVFERRMADGSFDIFIVNADGTNEINVTDSPGSERNPSWAPEGQRIAFEGRSDLGRSIDIIKIDGTDRVTVTGGEGEWNGAPAWSPDGSRILFESTKHQGTLGPESSRAYEVFVMDDDGANVTRVTGFATRTRTIRQPSWSPGGTSIAFESRDETQFANTFVFRIWTMNMDGTEVREIAIAGSARFPRWSPRP